MKIIFDESKSQKFYIDESGAIWSKKNCDVEGNFKLLKPNVNKKRGYLYARTPNKNFQIHRLVASAFIDNMDNKAQVNHINGIKHDNRVENLEWVTIKENAQHALKMGLTTPMKKNQGAIKYSNAQCASVIAWVGEGLTYKEAGKRHNMPYSTVAHLMRGSRRKIERVW